MTDTVEVAVIGGRPAGVTAALRARTARLARDAGMVVERLGQRDEGGPYDRRA